MLTKGEIQSIDFTGNSCRIRIPLFEVAGIEDKVYATAYFAVEPGKYNSYKPGDVVIIGFESDLIDKPIILGKLYTSINEDQLDDNGYRGSIDCTSLKVKENASIPISTKIIKNALSVKDDAATTTINDIINTINTNKTDIENIKKNLDITNDNLNYNEQLLWENPAPNSAFAAQDIALNMDYTKFKYIVIFYRFYFGNCVEQSLKIIPPNIVDNIMDSHNQTFITGGNYANDWASRQIDFIDRTHLKVYTGKRVDANNPTSGTNRTEFCIPTKIYGVNNL